MFEYRSLFQHGDAPVYFVPRGAIAAGEAFAVGGFFECGQAARARNT